MKLRLSLVAFCLLFVTFAIGQNKLPNVSLKGLDNKSINIANYNSSSKPVIVSFWATWCGPCKMLTPVFESLSKELSHEVSFAKVDIDRSLEVAQRYDIVSVPTVVLFKDGVEVDRIVGFLPKEQIKTKIKAHI